MVRDPDDFVPAFVAAWMARDGAALGALFAQDADFVNVVGIWWEHRAAITRAHSYALETFFGQTRLTAGRVKRRDLGDVCVLHTRMALSGQLAPDGSTAGARTTILTIVLARVEGSWTCVCAQNTDVVPGAETFVAGEGLAPTDYRAHP